jgi:hypothetical protein
MFVQTTKDVGAELESAVTNKEDKEELDVEGFSRDLVRVSVETPAPADAEAEEKEAETADKETTEDLIWVYFRTMGKKALLTKEAETLTFKRLERGLQLLAEVIREIRPKDREAIEHLQKFFTPEDQARLKQVSDSLSAAVPSIEKPLVALIRTVVGILAVKDAKDGQLRERWDRRCRSAGVDSKTILRWNEQLVRGEAIITEATKELVEANLKLVISIAKRAGTGVVGSDPGRQHGAHAGHHPLRVHEGVQVQHVRHLVDPTGHHPRPGRSIADDSDSGASDRGVSQDLDRAAGAQAGVLAGSDVEGNREADRDPGQESR